jgi:probable HAF family extracellular repeat protein
MRTLHLLPLALLATKRFAITGLLFLGILFGSPEGAVAEEIGFLDAGGIFTTINPPGASDTNAYGINDSGQVVGAFADSTGGVNGFVDTGGRLHHG